MSKFNKEPVDNESVKTDIDEDVKINYSDFLKDTEEIEAEIKKEEEIKKQKKKDKLKKLDKIKILPAKKKSYEAAEQDNLYDNNDINIADNPELKKADEIKERVMLIAFAVVIVAVIHISIAFVYYNNRFLPSTVINGENCSGKTIDEVSEIMKEKLSDYHLKILYNDITIDELYGSDIKLNYGDMDAVLQNICDSQNKLAWIKGIVFDLDEITTSEGFDYDAVTLEQFINSSLVLGMTSTVTSQNAGIEYVDGEYQIVPAVYGDEIDKTAFVNNIVKAVNSLNDTVDINNDNCFVLPALTEDNKTLIKSCKEANKLIKNKIEINATDDLFELPVDIKKNWLDVDGEGNLIFNEISFSKYMDRLENSYCTDDEETEFMTYHGDSVTVVGGDFRNEINREQLVADMSLAMLNEGDSRVVVQFISKENAEIGDSYIEVDLSNQMLWMYINGSEILASPVITGMDDGEHDTPEGIYRLKSKTTDTVVEENAESNDVSYWITVNNSIGICDAAWKTIFGGATYHTQGSDGSIYVLNDAAETIYENCFEGMPIIMYHHSIIESYFIENTYMSELIELIENRPEIPTYEGAEEAEEAENESEDNTAEEAAELSESENSEEISEETSEEENIDNSLPLENEEASNIEVQNENTDAEVLD